MFENVENW